MLIHAVKSRRKFIIKSIPRFKERKILDRGFLRGLRSPLTFNVVFKGGCYEQFNIPKMMWMSAQELLASLWPALESCKTKQVTETVIGLYTARAQMLGPDVAASVAAVVASYTPTEEKQIPDWLIKTRSGHVRQCVENYCRLFDHMYGDRTRLHDVLHMWQIYDEKTHEWRAWKEVD